MAPTCLLAASRRRVTFVPWYTFSSPSLPPMPPPDFDLPGSVLDEALSRLVAASDGERGVVLEALLAAHPGHRQGLLALGAALDGAGRVLARSFAAPVPALPQIEGFRVVRELGEGAFGIVYLCEQHEPIHREVAVKLLRPGAGDRATLARFDSERRFLARLHHPTIAQIFDAGLLPDGRPWFVMEHVPGVPLTEYCDRARLPIEARLRLFARLCQGVQHAHEQGIVHRDLKPANILVVEVDAEAQPKIIDFGIARALQRPAERAEHRTETGRVVGTPGYMSPEQAAGSLDEIDARSDLFSLGVVLYELLTGELPCGKRPESTASEPPRPSQRVGSDGPGTAMAQQRGSEPRKLKALLRGDLDWIVLKTLSRERSRRYATALELAAEIHRHLRGESVHAGPPSWGYRLRKLARRRRGVLSAAAAIAAMAGVASWLVGHYRTEASARGKEAESAVASLLARANDKSIIATPESAMVRKALAEDALGFYDRFLRDRPSDLHTREGRARTLWTLSQVHWLLGQFEQAERTAREAVADGEALLATDPESLDYRRILGNSERVLGRALYSLGRADDARPRFQRAVDLLERCHAAEPAKSADLLVHAMLELYSTMDPAAEVEQRADLLRRASELQERIVREHSDAAEDRDDLVRILLQSEVLAAGRGDLEAARAVLVRAESYVAAGLTPGTLASLHEQAAKLHRASGDQANARQRLEQAIAASRSWAAKEPGKAVPVAQLCTLLVERAESEQQFDDQVHTYREVVSLCEPWIARFPEDPRSLVYYLTCAHRLHILLVTPGRRSSLQGAEATARRARELLAHERPSFRLAPRLRVSTLGGLGLVADALGLPDAALVWTEAAAAMESWSANETIGPEAVAEYAMYAVRVARRQLEAGRDADAEALLVRVQGMLDEHRSAVPELAAHAPEAARLRAVLAARRGAFDVAADFAEQVLDASNDWRGAWIAADAMSVVWLAARAGNAAGAMAWRDRAIGLCQSAIDELSRLLPADPDDLWVVVPLAHTRIRLAQAQRDRGAEVDARALAAALDTLEAVRAEAHAAEWDERVFLAGKALLAR